MRSKATLTRGVAIDPVVRASVVQAAVQRPISPAAMATPIRRRNESARGAPAARRYRLLLIDTPEADVWWEDFRIFLELFTRTPRGSDPVSRVDSVASIGDEVQRLNNILAMVFSCRSLPEQRTNR